jgi:hypothetical protein
MKKQAEHRVPMQHVLEEGFVTQSWCYKDHSLEILYLNGICFDVRPIDAEWIQLLCKFHIAMIGTKI